MEFDELLSPLITKRRELTAERDRLRDQVSAVTEELQKVERVLRAAGLVERERRGPLKKHTDRAQGYSVSDEKLTGLTEWLRQNRNGGQTFTAPTLADDPAFDLMSRATVTNALHILREQGVIRLDGTGQGGSNIYTLTRKAAPK